MSIQLHEAGSRAVKASLGNIKREAKLMKRSADLKHHEALDEASKKAGFRSYRHAYSVLSQTNIGSAE